MVRAHALAHTLAPRSKLFFKKKHSNLRIKIQIHLIAQHFLERKRERECEREYIKHRVHPFDFDLDLDFEKLTQISDRSLAQ